MLTVLFSAPTSSKLRVDNVHYDLTESDLDVGGPGKSKLEHY